MNKRKREENSLLAGRELKERAGLWVQRGAALVETVTMYSLRRALK